MKTMTPSLIMFALLDALHRPSATSTHAQSRIVLASLTCAAGPANLGKYRHPCHPFGRSQNAAHPEPW